MRNLARTKNKNRKKERTSELGKPRLERNLIQSQERKPTKLAHLAKGKRRKSTPVQN